MSTGIETLDNILDGGIPLNSTIIIMGDKGTGKDALLNRIIYEGISNGQDSLFVTLDDSPNDVDEDSKYYGMDFEEYDSNLIYVDGYSWQAGGSDNRYALEGLSDMNQMNMTLTDAMNELKGEKKRIALNSASTLLLYTDPTSTVKFLQVMGAKTTSQNGCLFITLEESTHDNQTKSTVNHIADGVIKLKLDGDDKKISIERMEKTEHTRKWMDLLIDNEEGSLTIEDS